MQPSTMRVNTICTVYGITAEIAESVYYTTHLMIGEKKNPANDTYGFIYNTLYIMLRWVLLIISTVFLLNLCLKLIC